MSDDPAELLGPDGPFARRLPDFAPRAQQREMARAVAELLDGGGIFVSEAGTGTGKTFAYLVPALQASGKTVISTGTRTLQDQLFHRDLPLVGRILASPSRIALLKGRGNYLCLHRLDQAERAHGVADQWTAARLAAVREWSLRTESGEISEAPVPGYSDAGAVRGAGRSYEEGDAFWHLVTSNADNCLGTDCPAYADCFVARARRAAQEADVVVINHHLLFSDILLREEGFGELLPDADAFIIDEAHQIPELASRFFGTSISTRQLVDLARDSRRAASALDVSLEDEIHHLEEAIERVSRSLNLGRRVAPWDGSTGESALIGLQAGIAVLEERLGDESGRDPSLDHCRQRCQILRARLDAFGDADGVSTERIRWFESNARAFTLHSTPLDFADAFRRSIDRYRSRWLFTSATLAVGGSFAHYTGRLGIDDARTARWDSPFDFENNALLYLPDDLPEPGSPGHTAAVVEVARSIIAASRGRAFVLFTSHHALREAVRLFANPALEYPVFIQGTLPHHELLERFRRAGNGVLIGTGSFWEGVDVRGPALSCVIIDKLPFANPDDPVLQARAASIKARGGNAFRDHQLPAAVVALKQGIGRLIRDAGDCGVLAICDPRLMTRSYGSLFLDDLPPMRRTRILDEIADFFAGRSGGARLLGASAS